MSLINKVIADLEERQVLGTGNAGKVFQGLASADCTTPNHFYTTTRLFILLLFLLASVSATYALMEYRDNVVLETINSNIDLNVNNTKPLDSTRLDGEPGRVTKQLRSTPLKLDFSLQNLVTVENRVSTIESGSQSNTTPAEIDSIRLERNADAVNLHITVPSMVDYRAYSLSNPNRIVIHVDNAVFNGSLPETHAFEDLKNMRLIQEPVGDFMLVLDTDSFLTVDKMQLTPSSQGYDLSLALATNHETAPSIDELQMETLEQETGVREPAVAEYGEMKKNISTQHDKEQINRMFVEARELYQRGRSMQANSLLQKILEKNAEHREARSLLARKLISQGQLDKAEEVLKQGLDIQAAETDWADLYARLLVNKGRINEAIVVLELALPFISANPEFHAFLAALYQKAEKHQEAVLTYRQVLAVKPENSVWWMGLAISLETLRENADALYAYRKALNGAGMSPDLRKYVHGKVSYLSKRG